jgi:hypothetical protein
MRAPENFKSSARLPNFEETEKSKKLYSGLARVKRKSLKLAW